MLVLLAATAAVQWRRLSVALDGRTLLEETDVTLHDGRLLGVLPSFTDSGRPAVRTSR